MQNETTSQHLWLARLVGEWTFESSYSTGPGKPNEVSTGTEIVRALGSLWIIAEGKDDKQENGESMMILGYDPQKGRFVGSTIVASMSYLWPYDGALDENGQVLILESEGPSTTDDGQTAKYRDVMEFGDDGQRTFVSNTLGEDGEWREFMRVQYRRAG